MIMNLSRRRPTCSAARRTPGGYWPLLTGWSTAAAWSGTCWSEARLGRARLGGLRLAAGPGPQDAEADQHPDYRYSAQRQRRDRQTRAAQARLSRILVPPDHRRTP